MNLGMKNVWIRAAFFTFLLTVTLSYPLHAASVTFSTTARTNLEKTIAAANPTLSQQLTALYSSIQTAQTQEGTKDQAITDLHLANEEALISVRAKIKTIDADKISSLSLKVTQTKEKYKPLFALYTSLNQQLTAAKPFKSKELNAILRTQIDAMKIPVQLAKQDVRTKEETLKAAKSAVTQKAKDIRTILSGMDTLNVKIKAERSSISKTKKHASEALSALNQATKKQDTKRAHTALTTLASDLQSIVTYKQNIYTLESSIATIIAKADTQL